MKIGRIRKRRARRARERWRILGQAGIHLVTEFLAALAAQLVIHEVLEKRGARWAEDLETRRRKRKKNLDEREREHRLPRTADHG